MLNPDAPRPLLRRGLAAIFALALLTLGTAHADELQDAARFLKSGQHRQALERVNKVLAAKPRDAQARFLKGLIFTEQGNTRDAIDIFTKLSADYPELPEPYNNLAVIYASQGEYERAREALEQSIRTHPSYATAYENLGDVYAKLASQAYDKALQLDSANKGAQNKLSLVRELVGPVATATPPMVVAQKPAAPAPDMQPAEKSIAEKPTKKPVAEKPAASDPAEVLKALNAWAQAWSKRDTNAYLSFYAKDFRTPPGQTRAAWENTRRARIAAPKSIAVSIASPKVTMTGANQANVTFRQSYRSDRLRSTTTKTIVMVKSDGRWLIQQERTGS